MNDNNFENSGFNANSENNTFQYGVTPPIENKPKKGKVATIITTVAIILVASVVGGLIGSLIFGNDINDEIEEYIKKMEDYTPGTFTNKEYTSKHFGLKFEANGKWQMFSQSELEPLSKQIRDEGIAAGVESLKKDGIDQEIIDKWTDAFYAETEMGAGYVVENVVMGQVIVQVFGAHGTEDLDEDKYVEELKSELSKTIDDVSIGEETIAGKTFKTIKAKSNSVVNQMFVRIEDDMFCMIACSALEGYEDEIMNSFLAQISEYK